MERNSGGLIQKAKDLLGRLKTAREKPLRAKTWVQHGDLMLWTFEEGEIIPYHPVLTLEEVSETLGKLNCANVTQVKEGEDLTAVCWTVDYEKFLFGPGQIPPRTLRFYLDETGKLSYSCSSESQELRSGENQRVTSKLVWPTQEPEENYSQAKFTYRFLMPFAYEEHTRLASTDTFGFQFAGTEDKDKDVEVRMGGVKFRFIPSGLPNAPISGLVQIAVPGFEPKKS